MKPDVQDSGLLARTRGASIENQSSAWHTRMGIEDKLPAELRFESAPTRLVNSPIGIYREAAAKREARFGYRFTVNRVGCPHELVVRYPDDKPRYMCIMDGSTYDLSVGVFSGGCIPVSGRMQEVRKLFWPRWKECTVVFMTWCDGEPAAIASLEVRELDALPPAVIATHGNIEQREFGMSFEDPCGMGLGMGAPGREEWIERVAEFMQHTGQSLLVHPVAWYHGPLFPSEREPADTSELAVSPDRRIYWRYTTQPPDWITPLLDTCYRHGIDFLGELRFFRLGSLMERMNIDRESITAGADTVNNMLGNNQVQSGTMDWTVVYNARNIPELLARGLNVHVERLKGFPFAYGEKCHADIGGGYPSSIVPPGPIFNPVHPAVQKAALGFVREIGRRFGGHPAFRGIAVGLWCETFLWYVSLQRGYDDVSLRLFEEETGIDVGVPIDAPDRFSRRYAFLTTQCLDSWIAWRCRKVRDLLIAMRDALREAREDLHLVLVSHPANVAWAQQTPNQPVLRLLREAGFDAALLSGEPGIEIDMTTEGGAGLYGSDMTSLPSMAPDPSLPCPTGICIADSWVESWGTNKVFPCDTGDPNMEQLARIGGQHAELCRFTCEYPPDGFWYDDQWRICTPFPAGQHYLAPMARALADTDALRLTRGGLYPDTAHADEQRRFARAYRALPRIRFETVGEASGPAAVRTAVCGDLRCFYAVNRTPGVVTVVIRFSRQDIRLRTLASGRRLDVSSPWRLRLRPYQLRAFSLAMGVTLVQAETVRGQVNPGKKN